MGTISKFILINLMALNVAFAQEGEPESNKGLWRVAVNMGHAHITKGLQHGGEYGISAAAWAVDADYWFASKWAVGLHSDVILENFVIEEHTGVEEYDVLERNFPVAVVPAVSFKPTEHLAVITGVGGEFSKEESLMLVRVGAEYGWELPHHWELGVTVNYDLKTSYNTWMIGLGVSKFIGDHHAAHVRSHS